MSKTLTIKDLSEIRLDKKAGKKLILVGGCFDILHEGHISFLNKAKSLKGILLVMLESDKRVKELKGDKRPINTQSVRAKALSDLQSVDYIIKLPYFSKDKDYEILVKNLEPDIIAVTWGSSVFDWEKEYMEHTGGKIIQVIKRLEKYSTTKIVNSKL